MELAVELTTAKRHGWLVLRAVVFRRDGGCVAVQRHIMGDDVATDSCRAGEREAAKVINRWDLQYMEWDHIREQPGGRRYDDEAHGVTVCPWHHRGSGQRVDTSERRFKIRGYLARMYPDVWAGVAFMGS